MSKSRKNVECSQQKRYWKILTGCDEKIVLANQPSRDCFNKRNLYMVKHSDICIACWNGKPSGTANTIKFAKENGCKLRLIKLESFFK